MKLVDVNVLLYAVNQDSAHHVKVRNYWEAALAGEEPIGLAMIVILGFLRLSTNPRVFPSPLASAEAVARIDVWLSEPNVRTVVEPENHWPALRALLEESGTAGNLTTDAFLASLAITQGATLVSTDSDFARFGQLKWENPLRD